jgi:putative glycerol-1-phosphate prenyltransferase
MNEVYTKLTGMPKPAYFILIDPDKSGPEDAFRLALKAEELGVDGILIGSSMLMHRELDVCIKRLKDQINIPLLIFPGILNTFSPNADAILFLNMISSRNAQLLIGEQVRAAPLIREYGLEAISTAYILIESGKLTSVQYISNSLPVPRDKPDILSAHVIAAEYIGMKMIYLEAGSGAEMPVPTEMVKQARSITDLPIIVGGGIRNPETATAIAEAGADIIITGTVLEENKNQQLLSEFVQAIHSLRK